MSTLQARHRGHNIPDGVTTFNEIEYDREGGVFLNRTKLILLAVIVFLLTAFSAFLGRYTAERQFRQKADTGVADNQIPFLAVEPESYKVFLDPKLYAADGTVPKHDVDYDGKVEVIFRPKTDTSVISLHVGLLKIDGDPVLKRRLSMDTPTDQVLQDDSKYELNTDVDSDQETLTVTVSEILKAGHYYSLFIKFTGTIGRNPDGGFFKVVFDNKEVVKNKWYVATKLAPRKARNLLPCVDNPKHKAIFEMSVVRSKDTNVIFNTKVKSTEPYKDDLLLDHFEKTGLIRPDSLGLFMSNFISKPIQTDSSVELTVWSHDTTDSIEMITDVVPKTLNFMTSYLATNFPTNKLDIVIVPSTVVTTTENPGLIVIKDSVLGTTEKLSINDYQKSVEIVVSHVIRQWLMPLRGLDRGNNDDKWLNEAIVNFLKIINIDYIYPEWKFGDRYSLDRIQPVMFYDSWTNSEPLANYEHHTDLYQYVHSVKGTSILRMLNNTFTEDIFKQTLREYVHTEIYKYKDTISFWTLLDDNARNKSIQLPESSAVLQIVSTWMQNKNYPMVKLYIDGNDLVVKQFRFDYNEPKLTNDWVIPITLTSGAAYSTTVWLENSPEIRVPGYVSASNGTWILANQHQTGYYRVAYEDVLLDRISYEVTKGNTFDEYTVAQLIGDIIDEAFAGVIGFGDALGFMERVIQNASVYSGYWDAIFNAFNKLETILHNTKHYDSLSVYIEMVVEKANHLYQTSTINTTDKILGKMNAFSIAGHVELNEFVLWAKEQFEAWKKTTTDINPILPNYRKYVYCTAMQYATKDEQRFILSKYASTKWTPDRKTIAKSFSCSRNIHFLQTILSTGEIKFDDLIDIWKSIRDNPTAGPYVFNYLRNNWETLYQDYSESNVELLSIMLHAAIRGLNSLADLEVLQIFIEKYFGNTVENRNPKLLVVLHFEEEILRQKILWKEKYESVISSWITPKAEKRKLTTYKMEPEQNVLKVGKTITETTPAANVKTDGQTSENIEPAAVTNDGNIPVVIDRKQIEPVVNEAKKDKPVTNTVKQVITDINVPTETAAKDKPVLTTAEDNKPIVIPTEDNKPVVTPPVDDKPVSLAPSENKPVPTTVREKKPILTADENNEPVVTMTEDNKPVATTTDGNVNPAEDQKHDHHHGNDTHVNKQTVPDKPGGPVHEGGATVIESHETRKGEEYNHEK